VRCTQLSTVKIGECKEKLSVFELFKVPIFAANLEFQQGPKMRGDSDQYGINEHCFIFTDHYHHDVP